MKLALLAAATATAHAQHPDLLQALICACELAMRTRGFDTDLPTNLCAKPLCAQVAHDPELFGCSPATVRILGGLETCIATNVPFCYTWLPDISDLQKTAAVLEHIAQCFRPGITTEEPVLQ